METVVVIEATSTGRFYVSEIAKRGMHLVVVFPLLPKISESYQAFPKQLPTQVGRFPLI